MVKELGQENPLINPPIDLSATQQKIISILLQNNTIKIEEIANILELKSNTIKKNILFFTTCK